MAQNYAIAEFCTPAGAAAAKRALDAIEAAMRPDGGGAGRRPDGRVAQVKLLRSEHAAVKSIQSQFSRTLFVANLPQARLLPLPFFGFVYLFTGRQWQRTSQSAPGLLAQLCTLFSEREPQRSSQVCG
jgi:hypothetical protein